MEAVIVKISPDWVFIDVGASTRGTWTGASLSTRMGT
jgi:hypothetical protein